MVVSRQGDVPPLGWPSGTGQREVGLLEVVVIVFPLQLLLAARTVDPERARSPDATFSYAGARRATRRNRRRPIELHRRIESSHFFSQWRIVSWLPRRAAG